MMSEVTSRAAPSCQEDDDAHVNALYLALRYFRHMLWVALPGFKPEHLPDFPENYAQALTSDKQSYKGDLHLAQRRLLEHLQNSLPRALADSGCEQDAIRSPGYGFDITRLTPFPEERPVFILGGPRAGTTALSAALLGCEAFFGWQEGHLFSILPPALTALNAAWERVLKLEPAERQTYALDRLNVYEVLDAVVSTLHQVYARAKAGKKTRRWLDKTPNFRHTLVVPLLQHLYPQARFIFMHRHPLKQILSFTRRFPKQSPEFAALHWLFATSTWAGVRVVLAPGCFLELGQTDLCLRSEQTVGRLAGFLALEPQEAAAVQQFLQEKRPEATGSSDDAAEVSLDNLSWPEPFKVWLREAVAELALTWGYHLDGAPVFGSV